MSVSMPNVIIPYILFRINENRDSSVAALYASSAGSTTISPDNGVTQAWNDAKNYACRSYFAVDGVFTATYAQGVYSQDNITFTGVTGDINFPTPTGSVPWWAYRAQWTTGGGATTNMDWTSEVIMQRFYPNYQISTDTTQQGVPTNFYRIGTQSVGIYQIPAASGTVTIKAWRIPEDVTSTGSVIWISPFEWRILAVEAAILIINKASNDAQLQTRLPALIAERDDLVLNKYLSIQSHLRDTRGGILEVPFGTTPEMLGSGGKTAA